MFKRPPHLDLERGRFCWARETTTGGTGLTSPSGLGLSGPISREQEQGLKAWQPSGGGAGPAPGTATEQAEHLRIERPHPLCRTAALSPGI